ncbi:hypothetical protein [Altererythrobacter sp. GH1-8]|uniref:hypothetical protein n=1 Tax=Altererythrobacter sp. GH1-8 TaxID=3349333 RepID=UPI00374D099C
MASNVSITHVPSSAEHPLRVVRSEEESVESCSQVHCDHNPAWLELLREGLTFDCVGLAPRQPCESPPVAFRFDIEEKLELHSLEGIQLSPGSHLTGGGRSWPVLRGLLGLARDIVHHFEDARIACWPPSQSAIGRRFFESTITAWLDGGPFPALGLTAFADESDGSLVSVGLEHFIDQELRIEPELASDRLSATRLGLRLVNQLVLVGGIEQSERIVGPDGSRLLLRPSRNGKYVRVSRE